MKINSNLEQIKNAIFLMAKNLNIPIQQLYDEWDIDYRINLDEEFSETLFFLEHSLNILEEALENNDKETAYIALGRARLYSQNLMNFYTDIYDDLLRIGFSPEFKDKWPALSEDFIIPNHYDVKWPS